jgi:hypothetical protein
MKRKIKPFIKKILLNNRARPLVFEAFFEEFIYE